MRYVTIAALAAAFLYVPYRINSEIVYGWIFESGSLDLFLWFIEFAIIGLFDFVVQTLNRAF